MTDVYDLREPARAEIDAIKGPAVIEFGAPWCGYCMRAQPHLASAMASHPAVAHIKVEDGSGKPLGRSFRVKLWPTLVFMRDGVEVARLVRPSETRAIEEALRRIAG
ncbi:Thioredoxin [Cupriavidus basilensis]|uniref:Thioredoxin n=2 Tax=Cupriavidus basilensis TaxID=68895 RepID=A0A0C4YDS1_9BURK|nr:Thioredoxin [Cupriavidus basilensis]